MAAKYQFFKNPPSSLVETGAKPVLHVRIGEPGCAVL